MCVCVYVNAVYVCVLVDNTNNEILIKREPLVYTRARRAVQKKKSKEGKKERKARTVQQQ